MRRVDRRSCRRLLMVAVVMAAAWLLWACAGSADSPSAWHVAASQYDITSFAFCNDSVGWVVSRLATASGKQVHQTDDGGRSWQLCKGTIKGDMTSDLSSLPSRIDHLRSPGQVLCVGQKVLLTYGSGRAGNRATGTAQGSGVLASNDEGATWNRILSLAPASDSVLWLSAGDSDHLWVLCAAAEPESGMSTYLLATDDGGRSWKRLPAGAYGIPSHYSFTLASPPLIFIGALTGWSLYRPMAGDTEPLQSISTTTDGGLTWNSARSPIRQNELGILMGFCAFDDRHAWTTLFRLPGKKRNVLLSTVDGGRAWRREQATGLRRTLLGVYFADADHGWVAGCVGRKNRIVSTSDGGRSWKAEITLGRAQDTSLTDEWVFCVSTIT